MAYVLRRRSDEAIQRSLANKKKCPQLPQVFLPEFPHTETLLVKSNKLLLIMRINPAVPCLRCRECVVIIVITAAGDSKNAK